MKTMLRSKIFPLFFVIIVLWNELMICSDSFKLGVHQNLFLGRRIQSHHQLFVGRPTKKFSSTDDGQPLKYYELDDRPKQPSKPKKKEILPEDLLEYIPESEKSPNKSIKPKKSSNLNKNENTVKSEKIISPFDQFNPSKAKLRKSNKRLLLTEENVEVVLDEMRPFLKADGGNVRLVKIDGRTVILQLEGACGSCSSSAMTMKMGLEKRLKERIPTIDEVIQSSPQGPAVTEKEVEKVLEGIKKFISFLGGDISVVSIEGLEGLHHRIRLRLGGKLQEFQSLKLEIYQRLMKHFQVQKLDVEYVEEGEEGDDNDDDDEK